MLESRNKVVGVGGGCFASQFQSLPHHSEEDTERTVAAELCEGSGSANSNWS